MAKMVWWMIVILAMGLTVLACEEDGSNDDETSTDTDTDADTDTDTEDMSTDMDTSECTVTAQWGSGFNTGQQVGNWSIEAIFDANGDGTIDSDEQSPMSTSLGDIYCQGMNSVVVLLSAAT